MSKTDGKSVLAAVVIGAAAGYVAGILTAPKSGKETRADIKNAADKYVAEAQAKLQTIREDVSNLIEEATEKAKRYSEKGKKEVAQLVDKAKTAQFKAREVLGAVKNGEADDAELQKAVEDANKAKEHLAEYLKKA
jgi:gas vesicle protein